MFLGIDSTLGRISNLCRDVNMMVRWSKGFSITHVTYIVLWKSILVHASLN